MSRLDDRVTSVNEAKRAEKPTRRSFALAPMPPSDSNNQNRRPKMHPDSFRRPKMDPEADHWYDDPSSVFQGRRELAKQPTSLPAPPIVSILDELTYRRADYEASTGDREWLSIVSLPGVVYTAVDKLRARVRGPKPGVIPTLNCCISHGVNTLRQNAHLRSLISLKLHFDQTDHENADAEEVVAEFFRNFKMTNIPGVTRRQNIALPSSIRNALGTFADDLGMTESYLAVIASMYTLSGQPTVHPATRRHMLNVVGEFLRRSRWRADGCYALMVALTD